jgi:hypothetical protein
LIEGLLEVRDRENPNRNNAGAFQSLEKAFVLFFRLPSSVIPVIPAISMPFQNP